MTFTGLHAYPITPLEADGDPDLDALSVLVGSAADAGVDGVVVLATSGSGTSFEPSERDAVIRVAVAAAGDVPVHAGISAASAHHVVANARAAAEAGAAGLVLAPAAYLPLDDAEVRALYARVAAVTDLPVCFYNKPVQTGFDVSPATLADLAATTTVRAVKDPAALPTRQGTRVAGLRAALAGDVSVGLSGDVALLSGAEPADAWHTGLAALAPAEYDAVRRARVAGVGGGAEDGGAGGGADVGPRAEAQRAWLLELARALAATRPLAALHVLAGLLGTPTAAPRDALVPPDPAAVRQLEEIVARRP